MKKLNAMLAIIILAGACKKDPSVAPIDQLPQATHTGANTFGCLIDGKPFVTSGKTSRGLQPDGVVAIPYINTAWYIHAQNSNKQIDLQFDFNKNPTVPNTFIMANHYPYRGHYFYYPDGTLPTSSTEYDTDSTNTGTVTVTDYTSTFTSGTFAFDAINGDGQVVHITDGRFDIQF